MKTALEQIPIKDYVHGNQNFQWNLNMYSYENDPLYPKTFLTIEQIEVVQNRAKKMRAKMFLSILEGLFFSHVSKTQSPPKTQQIKLSSSKGFA